MTRVHAAKQLLAHGPLSLSEFVEITGWSYVKCRKTLGYLVDGCGMVIREAGLYRIAE